MAHVSAIWLRCLLCAGVVAATSLASASAQGTGPEPAAAPAAIGASGEAYLKALQLRRIETEVRYFDPTRPAPALETTAEPPVSDREDDASADRGRLQTALFAFLVLAGVVFLFLRFGGGLSVSFARAPQNAGRGGRVGAAQDTGAAPPSSLGAILAIADRRAALVSLAAAALSRAIAAQGLLFQKSWTARDVLRHLPPEAPLRDELRALVFASERVHFGGRDVSEDEFRVHVAQIRPLIEGARA